MELQTDVLYMMQTISAAQSESASKNTKTEDSDFGKLMEKTKDSTATTQDTQDTQQPENPAPPKEEEEADETALQELAAMQNLYLEANVSLVQVTEGETTQAAEAVNLTLQQQTAIPQEGVQQVQPEEVGQVLQQTVQQPTEQPVQETSEGVQTLEPDAVQQPAQTEGQQETRQSTDMNGKPMNTTVETQSEDGAEQSQGTESAVFGNVETAPVKVSETTNTQAAPNAEAESVESQVGKAVAQAVSQGESHVELQLNPEHLGKVTVELTHQEDGTILVTLHAENSQTRSLLERDASGLQQLLGRNTQQEVQVQVQVPHQEEAQQQDLKDGHQQQNHQQEQEQRHSREDNEDFLGRLRLGLISQEEV